jgi:ribosomal protein S18 acetylase RimI-like enzyme
MHDAISLRDATPEDAGFLFALYCDTRAGEMSGWGWSLEQQDAFLRMQFDMRQRSYAAAHPAATDRIVCDGKASIGRILTDSHGSAVNLVDIALLAAYRGRGIGTTLIRKLLNDCDLRGQLLSLQVAVGNPAERLYVRLGFLESGRDAMYVQMDRLPARTQPAPALPAQ